MAAVTFLDAFGYHTQNRFVEISLVWEQKHYLVCNALSLLISPITGIIRMVLAGITLSNDGLNPARRKFAMFQFLRGLGELFCLGPIFCGVDILATIYRIMILDTRRAS